MSPKKLKAQAGRLAEEARLAEELKARTARRAEDVDIFNLQLSHLKQGSRITSKHDSLTLQAIGEVAMELVATMVKHIRESRLTPTMAGLLADHLSRFEVEQSLALFGLNKANRPTTKRSQQTSAVYAFTEALRRGLDEKSALIEAFDAYFSAGPLGKTGKRRTYADEIKNPGGIKKADSTMKSTIRPLLVKMRLLPKVGPGRPARKSKIN